MFLDHEEAAVNAIMISEREANRLPPYEYVPVHCFCVLVGNTCNDPTISIGGYCLEEEMAHLLSTKTETNGKNTSYFPDRNIVIGSSLVDGKLGIMFAIGKERMVEYEGMTVSWLDLRHVLKGDTSQVW